MVIGVLFGRSYSLEGRPFDFCRRVFIYLFFSVSSWLDTPDRSALWRVPVVGNEYGEHFCRPDSIVSLSTALGIAWDVTQDLRLLGIVLRMCWGSR